MSGRGGKRSGAGKPPVGPRVEARLDADAKAGLERARAHLARERGAVPGSVTDAEAVRAALRAVPDAG